MFDQDFEHLRELLRARLPDYLKSRGINPESKFACVNPQHRDHPTTMSYSAQEHCVHCFSCGARFDIFALIGLDYHLSDFGAQFKKAHELLLGTPVPYQIQDQLDAHAFGRSAPSEQNRVPPQSQFKFERQAGVPSFEIEQGDYNLPKPHPFTPQSSRQDFEVSQSAPRSADMGAGPFAVPENSPFPQGMGLPGGGLSFKPRSQMNDPHASYSGYGAMGSGGMGPNPGFFPPRDEDLVPAHNYGEYLKKCRAAAHDTDYFKNRGLSDEVVERFGLGYDDHFVAGSDQLGSQILWRAAIIPFSDTFFMARNTAFADKDRIRKQGSFQFFNIKALEQSGSIFITEGEFDALALETLGYHAIALGGTGNVRYFLEAVRRRSPETNHTFYICLDDDKAGQDAAKDLAMGLFQMQVAYKRIDLSFPYKDVSEALLKDRETLKARLEDLDRLLSYNLLTLPQPRENVRLLKSQDDLLKLNVSPSLYTVCLRPHTGRQLLAALISERQSNLVYAGTLAQWQYLADLIKRPQSAVPTPQDTAWMSARLLEIRSDDLFADIAAGITACRVQGEEGFVTVADLTSCALDDCIRITAQLGRLCGQLHAPIIALCNTDAGRYVESQALQNLDVTLNGNGDFVCDTLDQAGRSLTFTLYNS